MRQETPTLSTKWEILLIKNNEVDHIAHTKFLYWPIIKYLMVKDFDMIVILC
jgi:hypothetical protein